MNNLEISKDVYFDRVRRQLKFQAHDGVDAFTDVDRYAIIRDDNQTILGIHSGDYIIRPYAKLAESVNEVVRECVDVDKYHITTQDQVYEDGKKYRRDINFWDDSIDLNNYHANGMRKTGLGKNADERIIPQLRIYSSLDGRWGQQIMWSSVYVVCLNGMVRPDWTFVVYNKPVSYTHLTLPTNREV